MLRSLLALLLAALTLSASRAEDPAKPDKKTQKGKVEVISGALAEALAKVELTDEQKQQLEDVKAKFLDKVSEAQRGMAAALTKEQRQLKKTATEEARAAGKKGKELKEAVLAALKLTDEQKKVLSDAETKVQQVQTEVREAVAALLTDEQKQTAGLNKPPKQKKPKDA